MVDWLDEIEARAKAAPAAEDIAEDFGNLYVAGGTIRFDFTDREAEGRAMSFVFGAKEDALRLIAEVRRLERALEDLLGMTCDTAERLHIKEALKRCP